MSKKAKPSLKDYLKTGKVRFEPSESKESSLSRKTEAAELFERLAEADRTMWSSIFSSGAEMQASPLDFVSAREDFRTMDRVRFTYYILDREGGPLRPVRSSVQIREPLVLLLKWDEKGTLTLYAPTVE